MSYKTNKKSTKIGLRGGDSKIDKIIVLYTRVSSVDQTTDRQKVDSKNYDLIIEDKVSGTIPFFERNGGQQLKKIIEQGYVKEVVIWSLDRCGRNLLDVLNTLKFFTSHNIQVDFISEGLKTLDAEGNENPISKMVISILGVFAEMQRNQIREAQAQGIRLAKARGVYKGRKQNTKESVAYFLKKTKNQKVIELLKKGYKGTEIAKILGVSPTTVTKVKKIGL